MARARNKDRMLFLTSDPPFRHPEWAVGELIDHKGQLYRITRWIQRSPVRLHRGGSVRQSEVWGRPVSDEELSEELASAAEKMLGGG